MTKQERINATFECKPTDRVPIYDLIRNDAGIEHFAGQAIDISNPAPTMIKAYNSFADATKSKIRMPTVEGSIVIINGEEYTTQRWTEWKVKEEQYDHLRLKQAVIDKLADLKEKHGTIQQTVQAYVEDIESKQAQIGDTVLFTNAPVTGCGLYWAYLFCGGLDKFTYLMCDEPELVDELLEAGFRYTMRFIEALPESFKPVATVIPEDIGGGSGTLFSPHYLRQALFPRLKQVANAYHERGIRLVLHSDGNLNSIMDDIVACEIDGLHPIETLAGMDIADLRTRYPKLVMLGGVDCSQLLPFSSAEEVYKTVRENIQAAGYGYFAGSSSEINNEVPLENIIALYEAVHCD